MTSSRTLSTLGILASLFSAAACGGDTSSSGNNSGGSGTATGSAGTTSAAGMTSTGPGYACGHEAPPNTNITDFSVWSAGNWGDDMSLTGGTFYYDGDGDEAVQVLTGEVIDGQFNLFGEISVGYAGFGFWFGPCVDGSAFTGISFTMSGNRSETQIIMQMQTSRNYPVDDVNSKGECEGDWGSGCDSNSIEILTEVEPGTPTQIDVLWTDFIGGVPVETLDASELLGVQWQLNCEEGTTCSPELVFDDVKFLQ